MAYGPKRSGKRRSTDDRRYTVRGIRRDPIDITKLSKALIGLAMAEAERQAQAEHATQNDENTEPETTSGDAPAPGGEGDD